MRRQSGKLLSWSHYRALLQVEDKKARDWYEKEALKNPEVKAEYDAGFKYYSEGVKKAVKV